VEKHGNEAGTSNQDLRKVRVNSKSNNGIRVKRWADKRRFNMSKEEKQRLLVSKIYVHNASLRLDKEREVK
jgi:hypothetical protein